MKSQNGDRHEARERDQELERVRIDVWLWRARFAKTRAAAARLVTEGGVRLIREAQARRLDKPSVTLACGDTLVLPQPANEGPAALRVVTVVLLGVRRGPPAEARTLYREAEADLVRTLDALA